MLIPLNKKKPNLTVIADSYFMAICRPTEKTVNIISYTLNFLFFNTWENGHGFSSAESLLTDDIHT